MMKSARTTNHHQNGPGRVPLPYGGGTAHSAWHRTVESLVRMGLLVSKSTWIKCLPEYADSPDYRELWEHLTKPQRRLLLGEPSKAKPHNATIWNADGTLTTIGEEIAWRGHNWYRHE